MGKRIKRQNTEGIGGKASGQEGGQKGGQKGDFCFKKPDLVRGIFCILVIVCCCGEKETGLKKDQPEFVFSTAQQRSFVPVLSFGRNHPVGRV